MGPYALSGGGGGGAQPPQRGHQKYGSQRSPSTTPARGDRELELQVPFVISHAEVPSAGSGVGGFKGVCHAGVLLLPNYAYVCYIRRGRRRTHWQT